MGIYRIIFKIISFFPFTRILLTEQLRRKRTWVISRLKVDGYDAVLMKLIVGLELNQVKYLNMR